MYGLYVGIAAFIGLLYLILYNSLVSKRNETENAFASIDAYLKKRYDLIPNLIETVKVYMQHEKSTLTEIAELRSKAISGKIEAEEKVELDNKISHALRAVNVAVENYPDLKANTNFLQLQAAMNEIEEQLSAARRAFNAATTRYNNAVEMFPSNLIAGLVGMKRKPLFEISETERTNINARNLFNN